MRVIYRGEPQCHCVFKLEVWYSQDRSRIDPDALIECDCGRRWIFRVPRTGEGHSWVLEDRYQIRS